MGKKKVWAGAISLLLSVCLAFPAFAETGTAETGTAESDMQTGISSFVTRLYQVCLDREPDEEGLQNWTELLQSGQMSGREVADSFLFSREFVEKNYCNEHYVEYLYQALLDREPDEEGKDTWIRALGNGAARESIAAGFLNSSEFSDLCQDYGITAGTAVSAGRGKTYQTGPCALDGNTDGTIDFVTRLYQVCLGRDPDTAGRNMWVTGLKSGNLTGSQAAYGFLFSEEFRSKNYCNDHYVEYLYETLLNRPSDAGGKESWLQVINTGGKREEVLNGFLNSAEFTDLCSFYGIDKGNLVAVPQYGTVPTGPCSIDGTPDGVTAFVTRLYQVCLGRDPDAAGLDNWTSQLWDHQGSGYSTVYGFFFSQEFLNKKCSNANYVDSLYHALFNRDPDPSGRSTWNTMLDSGKSRMAVLRGFANSQEFIDLCNSYGIVRGKVLNGKVIVLDPGHSAVLPYGSEPIGPGSSVYKPADATGTSGSASGLMEYQLTLQVAQQLRTELENRGYTVYLTREDSSSAHSCIERAQTANSRHADVFLRIHADGSASSSVSGASAICITPSNPFQSGMYSSSRRLSDCILDTYCSETGIYKRGVIEEDNMTGNNWSSVPTTLIEMGFMTNPQEDLKMASASFQTEMVGALADGIDQYCGQ